VPPQNGTPPNPSRQSSNMIGLLKGASRHVDAAATLFETDSRGLAFQQLGSASVRDPNGCPPVAGAKAFGAELEAEKCPRARTTLESPEPTPLGITD